jgi:chitinase
VRIFLFSQKKTKKTMQISKKLGEIDSEIGNEMLVALRPETPYIRTEQQRYGVTHDEVFTELLHIPGR